MKLRWIFLLSIVAIVFLTVPQSYVDADEGDEDDEGDDPEWIEIDDITYVPIDDVTVYANQCFKEDPVVVIPPTITYEDVTYEVVSIGTNFICTELESITIPYTVTELEDSCFECRTLKELKVDEDSLTFSSVDGVLYDKNKAMLIKVPSAKNINVYNIPATVTILSKGCFMDCTSLYEINMPNTIYVIPNRAFENCTNLEFINKTTLGNRLPDSIRMIAPNAFYNCSSLKQLTMPNELAYIDEEAFRGSGLTSFTIPKYVTYIASGAFGFCKNLERFIDGDGSTYVATDGILYETKGAEVILHSYPCARADEVFTITGETTDIMGKAFMGTNNLKEVILSPSLNTIPDLAFYACTSLERITIPDYILVIDYMAFCQCKNLKEITIMEGLVKIDGFAFAYTAVERITIPASVKYIEEDVMSSCESLVSVDVKSESLKIGGWTFANCPKLTEVNFYGTDITFNDTTLSYINSEQPVIVTVTKDVKFPDDMLLDPNVIIKIFGERPYPWENLIGVFFCVLFILLIVRSIREV